MNLNENEMRETAARICRDYLTGAWRTVAPAELQFKRISGGLSNFLYHVALPESPPGDSLSPSCPGGGGGGGGGGAVSGGLTASPPQPRTRSSSMFSSHNTNGSTSSSSAMLSAHAQCNGEPKQVLLRIYGQIHGEQAIEAIITESVVFTLLSERRLGPKLHGVFPGGRIEQYIPARPLKTSELSDPVLSVKIAEKMAAIHSMDVPLSKEPDWLWKTMSRWIHTVENNLNTYEKKNDHESRLVHKILNYKLRSEIDWLRQYLNTIDSPVVFSHNDMQEGNILLREDSSSSSNYHQERPASPILMNCPTSISVSNARDNKSNRYSSGSNNDDDGIACDFSQQMALHEDDNNSMNGDSDDFFENNSHHDTINEDDSNSTTDSFGSVEVESSTDSVLSGSSQRLCSSDPNLVLIDFEYCSYNYRGFDLANHFVEWSYDYGNGDHPYFYDRPEQYPSQEQQERFITAYLQSSRRYRNGHSVDTFGGSSPSSSSSDNNSRSSSLSQHDEGTNGAPPQQATPAEITRIMNEVRAFTLASHLFWGMWASVNASLSQIPFGYWDYASSRLDRYFDMKQNIVPMKSTLKRKINDLD